MSYFCVFERVSDNRRVLALRGSASCDDFVHDVNAFAWLFAVRGPADTISRIADAITSIEKLRIEHNFQAVVGHSLGGNLASFYCSHAGLPGAAFQAPGLTTGEIKVHDMEGKNIHPHFRVINARFDVIGNACNYRGNGHPFKTYFIPIFLHSIDELLTQKWRRNALC